MAKGSLLTVNGVYLKEDLKNGDNFTPYFNKDINNLPIPDIKLLDDYLSYTSFLTDRPLGTIVSSKGCPFVCNYCSSKSVKYSMYKIEKIMDALSYYVSCGVYEYEFWDETFNPSIRRLLDFAECTEKRITADDFCD